MTPNRIKHSLVASVLIWAGAGVSFIALINCLTGGNLWVTLGLFPFGGGMTVGGTLMIAKDQQASASESSRSPKT